MCLKLVQIFNRQWHISVYDEISVGYTNKTGTFKFRPKKTATRAEAAAFISRMIHTSEEFRAREIDEKEEPIPPIVEPPKPEPKPVPPVVDHTSHVNIMGASNISANKMAAFVKEKIRMHKTSMRLLKPLLKLAINMAYVEI